MRRLPHGIHALIVLVTLAPLPEVRAQSGPPVFEVDEINTALEPLDAPPNLATPQATVEFFMSACREEEFARAARAMNFRLIDDLDEQRAAELARRFYVALRQELWISWENLPDRPDGVDDFTSLSGSNPLVGEPRKSIALGSIEANDHAIPVRINRYEASTGEPVWLFSAQTVENVPAFYEAHGPGWLSRNLPEWAAERGWAGVLIWKWIALALVLAAAPLVGWGASALLVRAIAPRVPGGKRIISGFEWPVVAVCTTLLLYAAVRWLLMLPGPVAAVAGPLVLVALIASVAWVAIRVVGAFVDALAQRQSSKVADDETGEHKRAATQLTVARHALLLVVVALALGVILLQLDGLRAVGIAILSSAGAAAIVVGIAGHAVLGNLIAGIQIALTQPFKIGDNVLVEARWGWIEDIRYTYVVLRTWDDRRLVFPIRYFTREWFENLSMREASMLRPVDLHVGYTVDMDELRAAFAEALREETGDDDLDADERVFVHETRPDCQVVRLFVEAHDPVTSWRRHCAIRERMVAWLRETDKGAALPSRRLRLVAGSEPDGVGAQNGEPTEGVNA